MVNPENLEYPLYSPVNGNEDWPAGEPRVMGKILSAMNSYYLGVGSTGIIREVLIGIDDTEGIIHLVNVFSKPVNMGRKLPKGVKNEDLSTLTRVGQELCDALETTLRFNIGYINPSEVNQIREQFTKLQIDDIQAITIPLG